MAIAIAITGMTGTGKTHDAMEKVRECGLEPFIFDIIGQWKKAGFSGCFQGTFEEFAFQATKKKGCIIVYEEASKFFKNPSLKVRKDVDHVLTMKRHMKKNDECNGCIPVYLFISNRRFPIDEIDGINYWIMHKTNDFRQNMVKRFGEEPKILEAFDKVKASSDIHYSETIILQPAPTKY